MNERKTGLIILFLVILMVVIVVCSIIFIPKSEGYKTNEMTDQTNYDKQIQDFYNSDTMTIAIPLSANPKIEYHEDYLTITYDNPKIDWDNLDLKPPQETDGGK